MSQLDPVELQKAADFNRANPIGTMVRYWRGFKAGEPSGQGKTRSLAWVMPSGTAVVLIEGTSGGIALTHVEVVQEVANG
jgi:hypothetical protein